MGKFKRPRRNGYAVCSGFVCAQRQEIITVKSETSQNLCNPIAGVHNLESVEALLPTPPQLAPKPSSQSTAQSPLDLTANQNTIPSTARRVTHDTIAQPAPVLTPPASVQRSPLNSIIQSVVGSNRAEVDIESNQRLPGDPLTHLGAKTGSSLGSQTADQNTAPQTAPRVTTNLMTIASKVVAQKPASQYIISSQPLVAGAPGITMDGTLISLDPSATALVAGAATMSLPTAQDEAAITVGGLTFTRRPGSSIVIGTQTVTAGAPAVTEDIILVGGFRFTRGLSADLIVGTQTITPGGPTATISGIPVSLALSGTVLIVGSTTVPLRSAATMPGVLRLSGNAFTRASALAHIVGSQPLFSGGLAITVSGTTYSLPADPTAMAVDGLTVPVPIPTSSSKGPDIHGNLFTEVSASRLLVGSETLVIGGSAISFSGTTYSLPADATAVVVDGSSVPVPVPTSSPKVLVINGASFTDMFGSGFIVGLQTLVPGGSAITVNGTPVSLRPSATNLVLGWQTATLTASSQASGEIIIKDGFSSGGLEVPGATNISSVVGFTGGSSQGIVNHSGWAILGVIVAWILAEYI
ncbi:MAG: hypothetical protein Q9210_007093 [Variospora velana]